MENAAPKQSKVQKNPYRLTIILEGICILILLLVIIAPQYNTKHKKPQDISSIKNIEKPDKTDIAISQAQIDSWPTYIDEKDGYMIKHPSYIDFDGENYFLIGDNNRLDSADGFGPRLIIYNLGKESALASDLAKDKKSINVDTATQSQLESAISNMGYTFISKNKDKATEIQYGDNSYIKSIPPYRITLMTATVRAMLSTFQYLDPDMSTNALTGTFVNKKYGYSVQYPITWGYTDSNTTKNPNVADMSEVIFGEPRLVGALYVQDNLRTISSPVRTELSVRVEKPTNNDRKIINDNQNCVTTGKPYHFKNATATIFENTGCGIAGGVTFIDILHDNYFYEIQTTMIRSALDPILKTFTFTN